MKLDKLCYDVDEGIDNSSNSNGNTKQKYVPSLSFIEFLRYNVSPNIAKEIEEFVCDLINNNDTSSNSPDAMIRLLKQYCRLVRRGTYTSVAFRKDAAVKYVSFKINVLNSDVNESIEQLETMLLETSRLIISIDEITKPIVLVSKKIHDISTDIIDEEVLNEMHDIEHDLLIAIKDKKANKLMPGFLEKMDTTFYNFKYRFQTQTNAIYDKINAAQDHAAIRNVCSSLDNKSLTSIRSLINKFRYIERLFTLLKKDASIIEYDPIVDKDFIIPTRPIAISDSKLPETSPTSEKSAIIIQKQVRSKQAKKKVDEIRKSNTQTVQEKDEILLVKDTAESKSSEISAILIQKQVRGKQAKKKVDELRQLNGSDEILIIKDTVAEVKKISTAIETKPDIKSAIISNAKSSIAETKTLKTDATIAEIKSAKADTTVAETKASTIEKSQSK
jgi:hypothetical protein